MLNSRTPSSCVQFLYSSRKTNRLNSCLTKKSFSLLKYQDRYVPFGLFQFLLLFGRFGNICSKFMPLILKNFLLQKVRDTFHRSSCKIWQTMVAKVLCFWNPLSYINVFRILSVFIVYLLFCNSQICHKSSRQRISWVFMVNKKQSPT